MASRTTTDPIDILLEMGIDLDNLSEEEDYLSALKEAIAIILVKTKGAGDDKSKVLLDEVVKVRKSRKAADPKFKAKKTKISADSFKKGTATETAPQSVGQKALPPVNIKPKTSIIPYVKPNEVDVDDEEEGGKKKKAKARTRKTNKDQNLLEGIAKSVSNIADILKKQYGLKKKKASNDAKKAEAEQRKLKESGLEKRFKGLSKVAEKVIAPVKSVIDRILDFFLKIIVGRFLVKFIGWFGDPKNKKKVDSVIRFLTDHGPKLLAAFLLFGTGIGRFTVRLSALLIKGALRLGAAAAKFALGFARRHPAAAAITAIVGGAALVGAMNKKDDAGSVDVSSQNENPNLNIDKDSAPAMRAGGLVPQYEDGGEIDFKIKQSKEEKESLIPKLFGMTPTGMAIKGAKSAGSSIKEKGLGNAAMDFAGGAFGNLKGFMDEKGITDVLMQHPLAKMGAFGLGKGKEAFGNLKGFMDEKGITDTLMAHPFAKMGAFGLDKFMNFGKDPARDITGQSGQDVKGAGVDTQLISARPGDFVVNKKTATAMGPDYFDSISTNTGEKVSGAGPDTQMIAVRPGEIVINRETVGALGADHFLDLNRTFGGSGANKPKMAEVQSASGGGFVLPTFNKGGEVGSGDEPNNRPRGINSELFSGFGGETSKSENYSVRAVNEIVKRVYNMINADRERRGGSPPSSSGGRTPPSAPPSSGSNMPGAGAAEEVYNRGKDFVGGLVESGKSKVDGIMPQVQALPATIDYGSLFLKSQLGGLGGAITEADLSRTTKDEYTRAYQVALTKLPQRRAGVESVIRQQQRILSTPDITEEQKKNAKRTLLTNKSRLSKYDAGQVDVQYEDFKVDGKLTPTAAAAQKTMGAVWASDTGDGGFQIEKEPYDFPIVKDPVSLMRWKQLSEEEKYAWLDKQDSNLSVRKKLDPRPPYKGSLGKWGKQDIAEAMYSLNPAAAPMVTDVKIGGATRPEAIADSVLNTLESIPVVGQASSFMRGLGMNMVFGKTRDVTKGPLEGAAPDSIFRKLFPKQDKKADLKATNIADQSGGLGTPDSVKKPKITAAQIKNNQAFAASKGKYYSSTTGKTYASYAEALKNPEVAAGANKMEQKKESFMNMMVGGKDAYYSSTTGRYYKNYTEALKDPQVAAAAQVEKTKASFSFSKPSMTMPAPPPGGGSNVKVVRLPSPGGGNNPNNNQTGGSDVDATSPGNGNKAKWSILGIPMPF